MPESVSLLGVDGLRCREPRGVVGVGGAAAGAAGIAAADSDVSEALGSGKWPTDMDTRGGSEAAIVSEG